ncbi:hypothetical protein [Nonomuraea africana]|uniref:Exo-alpha-sialidase n=1 Tax=Nonomuraea africana TaxID=46171 RepID=A0ABR9KNY1_9ACTN|nr:hypothetical protein [Nonomuraea africana]MBE1563475.1 hypothetical protein [Nonomuraea africana]
MKIAQRAAALVVCVSLAAACSGERDGASGDAGAKASPTHALSTVAPPPAAPSPAPQKNSPPADTSSESGEKSTWVALSPRWKQVRSAPLRDASRLVDVVATGPDAAWAVGFHDGAEDDEGRPVMQRWNGRTWSKVALPPLSGPGGFDATGPDDIWFAGDAEVAHWDGRRWAVHRPFGIAEDKHFSDVSVHNGRALLIGSDASGSFIVSGEDGKFAFQFPGRSGAFHAISHRAGHAWVVGAKSRESCAGLTPMVLHSRQKHSSWEELRLPDIPGGSLRAVTQISPTDVWAIGEITNGGGNAHEGDPSCPDTYETAEDQPTTPLVLHWDGRAWRQMTVPPAKGSLTGVTAFGPDDVWVSGHESVVLHFNGRKWTAESAFGRGTVKAIAAIPGTKDLWAVGAIDEWTDEGEDFVLRRDGRGPRDGG